MLVSRLNIGGTEKYILSVSRNLLAQGVRVGVASKRGPLESSFRRAGINVHILSSGKKSKRTTLSSIMAKERYNLIHAHDSGSFGQAVTLSQEYRVPMITTVHGTYHQQTKLLAAARASKRIITVSPKLSEWLMKYQIPANKIQMIPNGIDSATFRSASNNKQWRRELRLPLTAQILVYSGRFSSDKYPIAKKVILAAERIAIRNSEFTAVLIGPGSNRKKLLQLAAKVNRCLGRRAVIILPPMTNIQHAYNAADIIVGTGRVALEAMACAKPVVAAGVAGYCGIIRSQNVNEVIKCNFGDHGAFAPITVQRLSKDISTLLSKPKEAQVLGEFGAKIVKQRFSIKTVGSRILQVYREVGKGQRNM